MFTCRVPVGKTLVVHNKDRLLVRVGEGALLAVKANVTERDTVVSFEGSRAGDYEWGWYFTDRT